MNPCLSQIIVYVSDMRRSIAFYRDLLGLTLLSESEQWSELSASDFHIGLHVANVREEVSGHISVPAGRAEIVFEVENLIQACARIEAMGGAVDGPKLMEDIGIQVAFLRDPDGMAIELVGRPG